METNLKFFGYYYNFLEKGNILDSYNSVLRFFKDKKKVISASIGLQNDKKDKPIESFDLNDFFPKETWFNEFYKNNNGTYEISDDHIKFKCGFVSYEGTILENSLELSVHSDYNGYEAMETYKFISFKELQYQKINLAQYLATNG